MRRSRRSDEVERRVAAIWADVLGVEEICGESDFFTLGGTSLAAVEIASRVALELAVDVPPQIVYSERTAGAYAQAVAGGRQGRSVSTPRRYDRSALSPWESEVWAWGYYDAAAQPVASTVVQLDGPLDVPALQRAFAELVQRHEILRTVYEVDDHRPRARVLPARAPRIEPQRVRARDLDTLLAEAKGEPVRLEQMPPWRVRLLQLGPHAHVLVLTMHEVLCDGEGDSAMLRDLSRLYRPGATNADVPMTQPMQYRDAIHLSRREAHPQGAEHWRRVLAHTRITLALPAETGGVHDPSRHTHSRAELRLPDVTAARLLALAQDEAATVFMAYLASFVMLMHRLSDDPHLTVTSPTANRTAPGQQDVIGLFSRLVPLNVEVADEPSFRTLLRRTRDTVLAASRYADELPLMKPRRTIDGLRGLSGDLPTFRLVAQERTDDLKLRHIRVSRHQQTALVSCLHMDVHLRDGGRTDASLDSHAGWTQPELRTLLDTWSTLLVGALNDPERPVAALVASGGHVGVGSMSRRAGRSGAAPSRIDALVDERIAAAPSATAIEHANGALSYGELGARAAALAARLADAGASTGAHVRVSIPPSAEAAIGMLAVLRLGATCVLVPDGSSDAAERCELLLSAGGSAGEVEVRANGGARSVVVGEPSSNGDEGGGTALVAWTTGVTGPPRAVSVSHAALVEQARRARATYGLVPEDRALHASGPGPRTWALAVWPYLAAGTCVVLPSDGEQAGTPPPRPDVTVAALPPVAAAAWLAAAPPRGAKLRVLRVQGPGPLPHVPVATGTPPPTIAHEYAVMEAGGVVLSMRDDGIAAIGGTPWCEVAIRDRNGAEAMIGTVGELSIATGGVLRPTGDLASRRADGTVWFLGRRRDRVTYRGFHLELPLASLERTLCTHPLVREAAVVWAPARAAAVACVVPETDRAPSASELDRWFRQQAPNGFRPWAYVLLDRLPRRADGSADRPALLPLVLQAEPPDGRGGDLERDLLKLWRKILGRRDVGVHDNFFALGGTFTLGLELVSRANASGIPLSPQQLLMAPTIAELTMVLARARART